PGVVEDHVEPPRGADRGGHDRRAILGPGQIGDHGDRLAAGLAYGGDRPVELVAARIGQGQPPPGPREPEGRGPYAPGRRPPNDRNPTLQPPPSRIHPTFLLCRDVVSTSRRTIERLCD